jgi:vacuolar-type H+-ATPase subunit I/STV1
MSWVLALSVVILLAAVVLIEFRAIREGDERRRHAPGYALVMGGLVMIGIGIAAALTDEGPIAVLVSLAGLTAVALATTQHKAVVIG